MEHFEGDSLAGSYGASVSAGAVEGIPVIVHTCGKVFLVFVNVAVPD